jgi:hypothetical protein
MKRDFRAIPSSSRSRRTHSISACPGKRRFGDCELPCRLIQENVPHLSRARVSPPHKWQVRFNASGIEVVSRIDKPVDPQVVEALLAKLADFKRAYSEDGIAVEELDAFGPTVGSKLSRRSRCSLSRKSTVKACSRPISASNSARSPAIL